MFKHSNDKNYGRDYNMKIATLTIRIAALPDWDLPKPKPRSKNNNNQCYLRAYVVTKQLPTYTL